MSDNIFTTLKSELIVAMKAKETQQANIIRLALNECNNFCIDKRLPTPITNDDAIFVLTKMVKQRRESIAQFTAAGRKELAVNEQFELDFLLNILPQPMDTEELKVVVLAIMQKHNISSMSQMKELMSHLSTYPSGVIDKSIVAQIVKSQLS